MSRSLLAEWRDALRDSGLDRTAKLVGFTLATYMNGKGEARPAIATLAEGASLGAGRKAAGAAIDRLEGAGFLEVKRSKGRGSHHYRATFPTAHAVRGSADAAAHFATSNSALSACNSARHAHESAESAERGADARQAAPARFDPDAVLRAAETLP